MVNDTHRHSARLLLMARDRVSMRAAAPRYPVRDAADRLAPAFSVALRAAFSVARKKPVSQMAKVLEGALEKVLPALLQKTVVVGGGVASTRLTMASELRIAAKKPLTMQFNAKNPRIAKWAKRHAAELIDGIAKATKDWIKEATTAHAEGQLDDVEYSAALKDAVGNEARAETIARTETMRAVHQGQREAWAQAVDEGLLDADMKRTWIVTADDRLCPICEPLDGETADLDGSYGEFDGPPAHPNCRCTEGLA